MKSSFNILDLTVKFPENVESDIKLTESVGIKLKYPTFALTKNIKDNNSTTSIAFELLVDCVEYIYDNDTLYYAHETPKDEIMTFLESLTKGQFEKIEKFIENLPKLDKKLDIKCDKCGFDHNLDIEGLESFFG